MERLIKITDGSLEVGVIPDLGGVVASLNLIGRPNILKADPTLWGKPPVIRERFDGDPAWEAYNGHIVWLGPQCEWWAQQTKNEKKRRDRDVWPPDPYINHGNYTLVGHSEDKIVMLGPKSEFSGVRLVKMVEIKNGKVRFYVAAQNFRNTPVSWDLWLNTRVDGYARCYAPSPSLDKVRIEGRVDEATDMSVYTHDQGYCTIDPKIPSKNRKERYAKAFIPAQKGMMAAFTSGQALIIKFKKHPAKSIHPLQALVEFYNYTNHDKNDALTELEYHAPYVTLLPGEMMEAEQTWEVYPFRTRPKHQECIDFLQSLSASKSRR